LYFLDTGLLSYLLRIRTDEDIRIHAQFGSIFESFIISEFLKGYLNSGEEPAIYFWRDSTGNEIDIIVDNGNELMPVENIIVDNGNELMPVEIKAGQTIASDFFKGIRFWKKLVKDDRLRAALVYGGERSYIRSDTYIYSWSVF
jgi:predicted AAA+ superfamily ATPase